MENPGYVLENWRIAFFLTKIVEIFEQLLNYFVIKYGLVLKGAKILQFTTAIPDRELQFSF